MKILIATSSFKNGGITSYAHEIIELLSKDHFVYVIIGDDSRAPINYPNVRVFYYETTDVSIKNSKSILDIINNDIKPNIIINSNALVISLISPYINNMVRIISVSHSLRYNEADVAAFNGKYVDKIVALSIYNKNYLERKFNFKMRNKIIVIYNFINEHTNSELILSKKIQNSPIKIVFAGGGAPSKNPDLVMSILDKLLSTTLSFLFYWIGNTNPPFKKFQRFKKIEELLPYDKRVVFTDKLSREDAIKIISEANIFLIPSRREGCPMALLEAMSFGTITITGDYKNACREIIEKENAGFVLPHKSTQAFVDLIISIIQNHSKYKHIYDLSLTTYKKYLSTEVWKEKMFDLIDCSNFDHKQRKSFSVKKYYMDVVCWKIVAFLNNIHLMCFEVLKSAIPFYLRNLKKNYNV